MRFPTKAPSDLTTGDRVHVWDVEHIVTAEPTPGTAGRTLVKVKMARRGTKLEADFRSDDRVLVYPEDWPSAEGGALNDPLRAAVADYDLATIEQDSARKALVGQVRVAIAAGMSEVQAAKIVGVTRMTIRAWLGK